MISSKSQVNKRLKMPWKAQDKAIKSIPDSCLDCWGVSNGRFRKTLFSELEGHSSQMYLATVGAIRDEFWADGRR